MITAILKEQTASEFLRIVNLNFQERHLDLQQESITSNIFAFLVANFANANAKCWPHSAGYLLLWVTRNSHTESLPLQNIEDMASPL